MALYLGFEVKSTLFARCKWPEQSDTSSRDLSGGRNMYPLTMTGLPAITLPCGFSQGGLPIGLQIIGRPFDEAGIIRIARNYEKSTDWHSRRPSL
jgi:Asp-tRNA(Asn)/Glu-tRNA(Gln) amidotransferase A subunit family amidase